MSPEIETSSGIIFKNAFFNEAFEIFFEVFCNFEVKIIATTYVHAVIVKLLW
jgi:hypothetical protein